MITTINCHRESVESIFVNHKNISNNKTVTEQPLISSMQMTLQKELRDSPTATQVIA